MEPVPVCMLKECDQPRELIRVNPKGVSIYRQKCWKHRRGPRKDSLRANNLKILYDLTVDQYAEMLKQQDYRCALCRVQHDGGRNFAVDHDHNCCPTEKTCGKCIRGLLCSRCNLFLGKLEANLNLTEKALFYLKGNLPLYFSL